MHVLDGERRSRRTLVLTEHFLPERGGSINWLLETYSRYRADEVIVVTTQGLDGSLTGEGLPFPVDRLPMRLKDWDPMRPSSFCWYARLLRHVWRRCRRRDIAQLHCAKVLPEGLIAILLSYVMRLPYVVYAHGEEILIAGSSRKLSWFLPRVYGNARLVIANSYHTKALLSAIGVPVERIRIVHPAVDATALQANEEAAIAVRARHRLGRSPLLLTLGRLQPRKGQDMVIRALPCILQRFPEVRYLIAGTGEDGDRLRRLAGELRVSDHVVFAGAVPDAERAAYYAACDVFIMPNRQIGPDIEGFGIVFLEAAAAGKPVIGGKSGGTGEAIVDGETGLRVDGTDANEIARAVVALLSDPVKARTLGENGRRRVVAEFTWEAAVQRTRQLAECA